MNLPQLVARGDRVWVQTVVPADLTPYRRAVQLSAARIGVWNPVSADDLLWHLDRQSTEHRTFLIHATHSDGEHGIVGKVNITNVVRGRFQNGTMGYDAYDPYVARGLFAEGMRLIIGLAFADAPQGMGLHRLEANVRPGNQPSAGVLRSLGFRREGFIRDMLLLGGADHQQRWRDHDAYALLARDWPAAPYREQSPMRMAVLLNGAHKDSPHRAPGVPLAGRLAGELGLPDLTAATAGVGEQDRDVLWRLLAASPIGGIIDVRSEGASRDVAARLLDAGFDPHHVAQVVVGRGQPIALGGLVIRLDDERELSPRDVARIALRARAAAVAE